MQQPAPPQLMYGMALTATYSDKYFGIKTGYLKRSMENSLYKQQDLV